MPSCRHQTERKAQRGKRAKAESELSPTSSGEESEGVRSSREAQRYSGTAAESQRGREGEAERERGRGREGERQRAEPAVRGLCAEEA